MNPTTLFTLLLTALLLPLTTAVPHDFFSNVTVSTLIQSNRPSSTIPGFGPITLERWQSVVRDQLLTFTGIPASSRSCRLSFYAPAGSNFHTQGNDILEVYYVNRDATASDTWAEAPYRIGTVGSVHVKQDPASVTVTTIKDQLPCTETMSFRVGVPATNNDGIIDFVQNQAVLFGDQSRLNSGFQLTYYVG